MKNDAMLREVLAIKDNFNQPKGYVMLTELIDKLRLDVAKDKVASPSKKKAVTALKRYLKNSQYKWMDCVSRIETNGETKYIASNGYSLMVLNDSLGAKIFEDEKKGDYPNFMSQVNQIYELHCYDVDVPTYDEFIKDLKANPDRVYDNKIPYIDLELSVADGFEKELIPENTHPTLRVNAKYLKAIYEVLGVKELKGYADKRGKGSIYLIGEDGECAILLPVVKNDDN